MRALLSAQLKLPAGFRRQDVLSFHQRDALHSAERVDGSQLYKGVAWHGSPACLHIDFGGRSAQVQLAIDGAARAGDQDRLEQMARRMLGLAQPVARFERAHRAHAQLGPLLQRNAGLRVPLSPAPFEALSWAITGQQISVAAAVAVRRQLIHAAGLRHSSGLWCFPEPGHVARMSEAALRRAGFSRAKASTLIALSEQAEAGELPLAQWLDAPEEESIRSRLLAIRGIGPWTVNYALLRGFGCLDGSLHGDVAVRRNLQRLLGKAGKVTPGEAQAWLAQFSPWRALVAAHLWAMGRRDGF